VVGNALTATIAGTQTPLLLTGSGQSWTAEQGPAPADATGYTMGAVDCPSASECIAVGVGEFTDDNPVRYGPVVLTDTDGSWSAARVQLPAAIDSGLSMTITGVSCPSVSLCFATGWYQDSSNDTAEHGLLLEWSDGSWTAMEAPLPAGADSSASVSLSGVSCPSVSLCFATGDYIPDSGVKGLLLTWSGGSWTGGYTPLPSDAVTNAEFISDLSGVSCPSPSNCVAVGYYYNNTSGAQNGLVVTWSGDSWTAAGAPQSADAASDIAVLSAVSCASATQCAALGRNSSGPALLTLSGGSWTATPLPLPSNYNTGWGTDDYDLGGISCPASSQCLAVGDYGDTNNDVDELLMTGPS
jgi:hypothetical protein